MEQNKLESLIETKVNVLTGFVLAWLIWEFIILPIWNLNTSPMDNFGMVFFFTIISVIRSYIWRRIFNTDYQSRLMSLLEQLSNFLSGFGISFILLNYVVNPFMQLHTTVYDNLLITAIFPIISVIRGYFWRRFFNARLHKKVNIFVTWLFKKKRG